MQVEIDSNSGFCHGVVTAIRKAEEQLALGRPLYCLGDIVHNNLEVERLCSQGLVTITHADLEQIHGARVLLRAHGEPPSTYATALRRDIEIVDATCPVVLALQRRIRRAYITCSKDTQIVIYGKKGHAEVNGLVGQTDGTAIVIERLEELDALDFTRPIDLYAQTTKSIEGLRGVVREIGQRMAYGVPFTHHDTICRQVSGRREGLRKFAAEHDVVLFVSGAKSSNGRVLYAECLQVNPRTHTVISPGDVRPEWFVDAETVGICGATSTPRWLMERVLDTVTKFGQVTEKS